MAKHQVVRDVGFDVAGKHFRHGEVIDGNVLIEDLEPGADAQAKAAQLTMRAEAEKAIAAGLEAGHIEEINEAAAVPAVEEG